MSLGDGRDVMLTATSGRSCVLMAKVPVSGGGSVTGLPLLGTLGVPQLAIPMLHDCGEQGE